MNAKQKLHQTYLRECAARLSGQNTSGLTVRQLCEQDQLSIYKYNYWKYMLKEEVIKQMLPDIIPVSFSISATRHLVRTNRTIRTNPSGPSVILCIDGISIEIDPAVPKDFLHTLVRAVHYA